MWEISAKHGNQPSGAEESRSRGGLFRAVYWKDEHESEEKLRLPHAVSLLPLFGSLERMREESDANDKEGSRCWKVLPGSIKHIGGSA